MSTLVISTRDMAEAFTASSQEDMLVRMRSSSEYSFHHSKISPVQGSFSPPQMNTAQLFCPLPLNDLPILPWGKTKNRSPKASLNTSHTCRVLLLWLPKLQPFWSTGWQNPYDFLSYKDLDQYHSHICPLNIILLTATNLLGFPEILQVTSGIHNVLQVIVEVLLVHFCMV